MVTCIRFLFFFLQACTLVPRRSNKNFCLTTFVINTYSYVGLWETKSVRVCVRVLCLWERLRIPKGMNGREGTPVWLCMLCECLCMWLDTCSPLTFRFWGQITAVTQWAWLLPRNNSKHIKDTRAEAQSCEIKLGSVRPQISHSTTQTYEH